MTNLVIPEARRRLVFYLAAEEWAARNAPESFFLWSVEPTVIFGRNQDMETEVNVPYCRARGIEMYRRKSGGGCVYADKGNLMISYITARTDVGRVFSLYLEQLAGVLRGLGHDAVTTANNDVLVDGRKVSGNACYATAQGCIVHGTLLYDTDFVRMEQAITPPPSKLEGKGIKSVRQRVANLRELGLELPLDELKLKIIHYFCKREEVLSETAIGRISEMEKDYLDNIFIKYGRRV